MSSLLEFFKTCEKANKKAGKQVIKPIIGMESYIVNDRRVKVKGEHNKHLLLIARNQTGYKNLLKLHYEGYATGSTYVYDRIVPRIDKTLLSREKCTGLIATTGCLASEINQLLMADDWEAAVKLAEYYKNIFDAYYAELQPDKYIGQDQAIANEKIKKLAEMLDIPLICTTDSHYIEASERDEHQLVLAIQSKKDIHDPDRFTFNAAPLLSTEEMVDIFGEETVANTQKIADMCEYPKFLGEHGYRMPKYPIPAEDEEFKKWEKEHCESVGAADGSYNYCLYLVEKNWGQKLRQTKGNVELERKYRDRLKTEIEIIKNMGFIDYFLIVWDFVDWCKRNDIMTGCGRGSAGGCLLSYLLGITKLDPIKYDLLFSRFLNKDRISMPDIDMDIDKARRDEVKEYLAQKYGKDRVASIATFGRMKVRACIKDIIRSLQLGGGKSESFELADRINKSIETLADDVSYKEAIDESPEFAKFMEKYPEVAKYAQAFEDLIRQTGIHAAGVIIGAEPLTDTIPLMVDKKGVVATAYDGATLEGDGFLKMDLLGLKNLTIITDAIKNIKKVRSEDFSGFYTKGVDFIDSEPDSMWEERVKQVSDGMQKASKSYKILRDGHSNAVFQVESDVMKGLLKGIQVNNIEDISAVLALCRPGPLASGLTSEYGKRKRGGEDLDEWYLHPAVKPVLGRTYGIIVYQEQCMQLAVLCAGFTEPEADILRKAIGKKIADLMAKFEQKFIEGCMKNSGMGKPAAQKVWDAVKEFASYGFNKSHAVGYAHTTFQTAYLKANYPAEFWGAVLSNEADQNQINSYIREAINSGIRVLPVDVNKSTMRYEVEDTRTIRRNLTTLKGVGASAVAEIILQRPFKNMVDFLSRCNTKKVTSRVIETLIKAGAFDSAFSNEKVTRKTYYDYYDDCRTKIKRHMKRHGNLEEFPAYNWVNPVNTKKKGRGDTGEEVTIPVERYSKDDREKWSNTEIVRFESEIYGVPVTYNIFDFHLAVEKQFKLQCGENIHTFSQSLDDKEHEDKVFMMVVVKGILKKTPYAKDKSKFVYRYLMEDRTGEGLITVFDRDYKQHSMALKTGNTLVIECNVNVFKERKGLVLGRVVKNCGGIDGRT